MRDFKGMKRNRNRNRGGGGGGPKPQQNANRAFDSNGPEGIKVRGAAQSVYEKYQQLARDAQTSGDRVLAENYLQHAEHYFRLIRAMQPQRPVSDIIGRDQFVSGYDIDFEEEPPVSDGSEPEVAEATEASDGGDRSFRSDNRFEGERRYENDRRRDDRYDQNRRDDRFQNDRSAGDRGPNDRASSDRASGDRNFSERRDGDRYGQRADQRRDERGEGDRRRDDRGQQRPWREDRYAGDRPRYPENRPAARDGVEFTGEDAPPVGVAVVEPETPVAETERLLRADDGEVNAAPAFLQVRATEGEEGRRPRRRRAPRTFEPAESPAPTDEDA